MPDDLVAACRALYDAIEELDAIAAECAGISRSDLRCLNILAKGPASPGTLGASLRLTSGSVTTLVGRLVKAGLAQRSQNTTDKRGVLVHATPQAFEILGPIYATVADRIGQTAQSYTAQDRRAAVRHVMDAAAAYQRTIDDQVNK